MERGSKQSYDQHSSSAQLATWTDSKSKSKAAPNNPKSSSGAKRQEPDSGNRNNNQGDLGPSKANQGKNVEYLPPKEEDYGEEDFEDYNEEDFEAEEKPIAPVLKPPPEKKESNPQLSYIEAKKLKDEAKKSQGTSSSPAAPASVKVNSEPVSSSSSSGARPKKSMSMLPDPRFFRVQKIRDSNVMDLAIDKSTQLNILPRTKYEMYQSILRQLPEPPIKQMGVPISLEKRDMEINTDEITMVDKEMQFCYGDDTALFNTINDIRRKNDHTGNHRVATNYVESVTSFDGDSFESNVRGAAKLTAFLNYSTHLFESSLPVASGSEEKSSERSSSSSASKGNIFTVFAPDSNWITLGGDKANGANELINTRKAVSLRFSSLNSNLIVAAYQYPPPEDDPELDVDLKPFKGLYCIWDLSNPGGPSFILEAAGQPTCCCFSGSQHHIVIAGTKEGSLHLWDLRESSFVHKDRDAIDLKIAKGIRKPSYSTHLSGIQIAATLHRHGSNSNGHDEETELHAAPVVQIEPLDTNNIINDDKSFAGVSQFVSIDEAGVIMFWVTSSQSVAISGSDAISGSSAGTGGRQVLEDFGRSPWSRVSLLQTRRLQLSSISLSRSISSSSTDSYSQQKTSNSRQQQQLGESIKSARNSNSSLISSLPTQLAVLATLPSDLSTLLVAATSGSVMKLARFGEPPHPHVLKRADHLECLSAVGGVLSEGDEERKSITSSSSSSSSKSMSSSNAKSAKEVKYFAAVSSMAVSSSQLTTGVDRDLENSKVGESSAALVLVGRTDGTVDLFRTDCEIPLQSWTLSSFGKDHRDGSAKRSSNEDNNKSAASVVMVRWFPTRAAAFLAVDSQGNLYEFDLLQDPLVPIGVEKLSTVSKLSSQALDVCSSSAAVVAPYGRDHQLYLAVASGGPMGPYVRKLNRPKPPPGTITGGGVGAVDEVQLLSNSFDQVAVRSAIEQFVAAIPDLGRSKDGFK